MFLIFLPKINILIYHFVPPEMNFFLASSEKRKQQKKRIFWSSAHDYLHRFVIFRKGSRGWNFIMKKSQRPSTLIYWHFGTSPVVDHQKQKIKEVIKIFLRSNEKYLSYDCVKEILIGFSVFWAGSSRKNFDNFRRIIHLVSHLMTKSKKILANFFLLNDKVKVIKHWLQSPGKCWRLRNGSEHIRINISLEFPFSDIIFQRLVAYAS